PPGPAGRSGGLRVPPVRRARSRLEPPAAGRRPARTAKPARTRPSPALRAGPAWATDGLRAPGVPGEGSGGGRVAGSRPTHHPTHHPIHRRKTAVVVGMVGMVG